jgi:predicted XRE-type DNA-binding protein
VPPPSPQPNLANVMAVQTQLMQTITQLLAQNNNNNNNHSGQHRNVQEGFQKKAENFNKLRLPTFDHAADPTDLDIWLREI